MWHQVAALAGASGVALGESVAEARNQTKCFKIIRTLRRHIIPGTACPTSTCLVGYPLGTRHDTQDAESVGACHVYVPTAVVMSTA